MSATMQKYLTYNSKHSLIPMTLARETGTINPPHFWRQFLVRVSCKSGTRFVWYQIPAPNRTLFCSKSVSRVHLTEMIIHDLFFFNLRLATIPTIIIAATSANSSSMSLSAMFIFGPRNEILIPDVYGSHLIMHWIIGLTGDIAAISDPNPNPSPNPLAQLSNSPLVHPI